MNSLRRVFAELIKPALELAGLDVFRADEEGRAGDIRSDMFQELLIADLVVADLTLANPNVWYELGVRHALRARGVVIVCGGQVTTAFDLYTDRKLRYGIKDGAHDPASLPEDIKNLTDMVRATMQSWHGRKVSPVYQLLPNLQEPDWKSLRIGDVREFWEQYDAWEDRIRLAGKAGRIGDVLVLADEAPVATFRADVEFIKGDLNDPDAVGQAVGGVDCVFHEAALASVPRSVERPLDTNLACVTGTLNLLDQARRAGVRRVEMHRHAVPVPVQPKRSTELAENHMKANHRGSIMADHSRHHGNTGGDGAGRWVFWCFMAIAAYFVLAEHRAHAIQYLPFLFLLACPLMHLFHGHGGHRRDEGAGAREVQAGDEESAGKSEAPKKHGGGFH